MDSVVAAQCVGLSEVFEVVELVVEAKAFVFRIECRWEEPV